jgi:hypothetical protein
MKQKPCKSLQKTATGKAYASPALIRYGNVRELTSGGSFGAPEANPMIPDQPPYKLRP